MIIKALILSTMLSTDPILLAMPPTDKTELQGRKRNRGNKGRRRGGKGLR